MRKNKRPLYRAKTWNRKQRANNKQKKKTEWHKNERNQNKSVLFVPATKNSELRNIYEREVKKSGLNIKIVERSGKKLKDTLQKSYPFPREKCEDQEKCLICQNNGKGNCKRSNVTYEIVCNTCNSKYIGET